MMDKDTFEAVSYMVRTAHPGEFYADDEYCIRGARCSTSYSSMSSSSNETRIVEVARPKRQHSSCKQGPVTV